ncbi:ribonuclease-like [Pelodiscus sinensis]|uniref:ribonuclease-like n=1 Tax=Pelodiscus sinensis TaxID=13735 RepID=UPI003F6D2607
MAQTGPRPALLPLLLLLGALLLAGPGRAQRETRHEKFHRQHVDHPRTSAPDARRYCNQLMAQRKLTGAACKPTNTFLHAPPAQVDGVCGPGGTPSTGNYHESLEPMELTVCRLAGGSPSPPCTYRGRTGTHRVRLACEAGLPVHFQRQL